MLDRTADILAQTKAEPTAGPADILFLRLCLFTILCYEMGSTNTVLLLHPRLQTTPPHLCGWVMSWSSNFPHEHHFYLIDWLFRLFRPGYLAYVAFQAQRSSFRDDNLRDSVSFTEKGIFYKSLITGKAQGSPRDLLKTWSWKPGSLPSPPSFSFHWTRQVAFHISCILALRQWELMLQKKEMPGGKTVKSDITQPLNFYFVFFTIWVTK